ncbi:Mov34/MPN/PAD-1 family protein [Ekhidna sp.]|uniref:Mov34/MPN/PAD-1 family protein n=1 Tax=Ekhidna sp. TaxID=2608089 RepID=UPI003298BC75
MRELKRLGNNTRESGAFLVGKKGSRKISSYLPYTMFDPNCLDSGIVRFSSNGQVRLSKYCREHNLTVLADVHTHPGSSTQQSYADKTHPMVNRKGHIAYIIPFYAKGMWPLFSGVSFYEYQGDFEWTKAMKPKITLL